MGEYSKDAACAVYEHFKDSSSATRCDTEVHLFDFIRSAHPDQHVTAVESRQADLISFAAAGHAEATLLRDRDELVTARTYTRPKTRMETGDGTLGEHVTFGLYDYQFEKHQLQMYNVEFMVGERRKLRMYYLLTPKDKIGAGSEHSPIADRLIKAAGHWNSQPHEEIYIFDGGCWSKNQKLWETVQAASWDDVILDPTMKETLIKDVETFFDSRSVYEEYSVPWKRGIILHGTPGCGKTISIKALMSSMQKRNVASMYVKSFQNQGGGNAIASMFHLARNMAPCILIFEDLDSLVVDKVRSYFLNEVDGLELNDGILMIGSTNHLERLDPGISKRPSRFDRKYHFKLPGEAERMLYCEYWRKKVQNNASIGFHPEISAVVAKLTEGFSYAYMKELFVQSFLAIASGRTEANDDGDDNESAIVVEVADQTRIVDGSASLVRKDESLESTAPSREATEQQQSPTKQMPTVDVPEHLKENALMRILQKQAAALWKDMDNTESDEIHERTKVPHEPKGEWNQLREGRMVFRSYNNS